MSTISREAYAEGKEMERIQKLFLEAVDDMPKDIREWIYALVEALSNHYMERGMFANFVTADRCACLAIAAMVWSEAAGGCPLSEVTNTGWRVSLPVSQIERE